MTETSKDSKQSNADRGLPTQRNRWSAPESQERAQEALDPLGISRTHGSMIPEDCMGDIQRLPETAESRLR